MTSFGEVECEDVTAGANGYFGIKPGTFVKVLKAAIKEWLYLSKVRREPPTPDRNVPRPPNSRQTKGYVEKLCALSNECERLRLRYESNSDYKKGKRFEGFDEFGDKYTNLMMTQSFDWELFDIPKFFKKLM